MARNKCALLVAVICAIGAFYWLGGQKYLTPDFFRGLYGNNPALTAIVFFISYVAVTGLSLPGAAVLTLMSGFIFGFWPALLMVSFASSMGATLAFLFSRTLLREWVQGTLASYMETINKGIARDGAFYLFTLRLVPAVPFFVINLVMGLMPIKAWTFYWVSQAGMLAGTAVYINAGAQVGKIEELSVTGILTPALISSFVLLGLFPLLVRKGMDYWKKYRQGERE